MQLPGRVAQVHIAVQLYSLPGSQVGVQHSWHHTPWILPGSLLPTLFLFPKRPEDQQVSLASGAVNISFRQWLRGTFGGNLVIKSSTVFSISMA